MGVRFSIYLSDDLFRWLKEEAKRAKRSRSNFIEKVLLDLKEGRLVRAEAPAKAEPRKTGLPPLART